MNIELMIMKRKLNKICKELNQHLPVKSQEDIDSLNSILAKACEEIPEFRMYWHRDIYINCGFDNKKMRNLVRNGGNVHYEVVDDLEEHIGVIVKYN